MSPPTTATATPRTSEDREPFLNELDRDDGDLIKKRNKRAWLHSPVWVCCVAMLLAVVIGQNLYLLMGQGHEKGFNTDLAYLQHSIRTHRQRFAGAIRATPDGSRLHVPDPALNHQGRRFTGPPSPEVDEAWHELIFGRYGHFSTPELAWLNADKGVPPLMLLNATTRYLDYIPVTGAYGGPDMLHSLHCINGLRQHIDKDYYNDSMAEVPKEYERMHVDHCLEQLRQAVLCHGDLTPVTLRPVINEAGHAWALLGETEREHTCRNGEELGRLWRERGVREGRLGSE